MSNRQSIPLLQMFPQCVFGRGHVGSGAELPKYNAAIHQSTRSVELEVSFAVPPAEQALEELKRAICSAYGLGAAVFPVKRAGSTGGASGRRGAKGDPFPEEAPPEELPLPCEEVPDSAESVFARTEALRQEAMRKALQNRPAVGKPRRELKPVVGMIYGKSIRGKVIPMREVSLDLRRVVVSGKVFAVDHRELKSAMPGWCGFI